MTHRVLVAGVGNIFLGDDAFGVEVVHKLLRRTLPPGVRVIDFGIRGLDLAYALVDGYESVIIVDAIPRGGEPGTLYVLEPEIKREQTGPLLVEGHNLDPVRVLQTAAMLGVTVRRLLVVGCEPSSMEVEEKEGLSEPVRAGVEGAVALVESLIQQLLNDTCETTTEELTCTA